MHHLHSCKVKSKHKTLTFLKFHPLNLKLHRRLYLHTATFERRALAFVIQLLFVQVLNNFILEMAC